MPQDSTGNQIHIGDAVWFRGDLYTIREFGPWTGACGTAVIYFEEEQHTDEVADELSVDKEGGVR